MNVKGHEEYLLLGKSVDALISEHNRLKSLVADLENQLSETKAVLATKNEELKELQTRYERAKLSGVLLGSGGDASVAKRRVTELVREIDKCIALLDR